MSSSATGPTSTTASSTNSASNPAAEEVEIVACGALASHLREIAARRGWRGMVRPLPAALHDLAAEGGVSRLPGLHCYDLYAGAQEIEQLFADEPGTYLLTDYLIKSFDRAVIQPLGLDRHPDLWTDYFGHCSRLVWLAQGATSELEEAATRIACQFNLPLTRIDTGTKRLEAALAVLLEEN